MDLTSGPPIDGPEPGLKLNFPEQHARLAQCMNALRQTGRYCDITVKIQDKSFSCHRAVLACRTPLFQCLGNEPIVRVDFLHPAAFSALLDYMYTSELTVSSGQCSDEDLLTTAQALRLHPVVEWLTDYLKAKGAVEQVLGGGEGNLPDTAPPSLMIPDLPNDLRNNTPTTLFPRVSFQPDLLNTSASYSPGTELQAAAAPQKQPIETLFFRNTGKSNGVAAETTANGPTAAPARWDQQLSTCHRCGVYFLSTKVLKQHQAVCGGGVGAAPTCTEDVVAEAPPRKAVFGCARCLQYFISAKSLQMHARVCPKMKDFKCSLCDLRFVSQRALDFHTRDCFKSVQQFESPQASRNTNVTGNTAKPNEVDAFSRRGDEEIGNALLPDTSEVQLLENSDEENIPLEMSCSEDDSEVTIKDSAQVVTESRSTTTTLFSSSSFQADPHPRERWVCTLCSVPFPTERSLRNHTYWCRNRVQRDDRNQADQSVVSETTTATSVSKPQQSENAVTGEATVVENIDLTKSEDAVTREAAFVKIVTLTESQYRSSGASRSAASEKESESATAKTGNQQSIPMTENNRDATEVRNKRSNGLSTGASHGGSGPTVTALRSSPRHLGRTLRSSPKRPNVLSNVAKGNLRIKLIKKVNRAVASQAAGRRGSIAKSVPTTAGKSIEKASTSPKVARLGGAKVASPKPEAATMPSTGKETTSTQSTAQESPLNVLNKSAPGKDASTGNKTTADAQGSQGNTNKTESTAASTNVMLKPRPRVVLRRVDTLIGRSEGGNAITADINTTIKVETVDDAEDLLERSGSADRPSGTNSSSPRPETSLFSAQYHCNNCGLSFPQRKGMQAHELKCCEAFQEAYCQQLSQAAESHSCHSCKQLFPSDSALRKHREECRDGILYRCKLCWEDTNQPKAHMEKHWRWDRPMELRRNPCLSVERDLSLIKTLYMSVVKRNERWLCGLCKTETRGGGKRRTSDASFKDKLRLWSHQASVHGIVWRKLTCPECTGSFRFTTRVDFLRHMFVKHVELSKAKKTFSCQVCGRCYHDRGLLELHLFKHGKQAAK